MNIVKMTGKDGFTRYFRVREGHTIEGTLSYFRSRGYTDVKVLNVEEGSDNGDQ